MNIIINKEEHKFLQAHVMERYTVGSYMYGTQDENSDRDVLCVYRLPPEWQFLHGLPCIHQFQYKCKETNTDYLYTDERQFWQNQSSGDSTINSDVIMFSETDLNRQEALALCQTHKVIKAYLGFANRDLKFAAKDKKRLFHAQRSIYCAGCLINGVLPSVKVFIGIKNNPASVKILRATYNYLRKQLRHLHNENEIRTYWIPTVKDTLLQKRLNANNIREFKY